jgi:hypothetical protein
VSFKTSVAPFQGGFVPNPIIMPTQATAPVSPANQGAIRYNNSVTSWQVSVNGGAWTNLATSAGETWASVLAAGNVSGGTNPTISSGDSLIFLSSAPEATVGAGIGSGNPGLSISGGTVNATGVGGIVQITAGASLAAFGGGVAGQLIMSGGSSNSGTAAGLAQISGGNNTSTGNGGALQLIGGATVSATPGPIEFGFNGAFPMTLGVDKGLSLASTTSSAAIGNIMWTPTPLAAGNSITSLGSLTDVFNVNGGGSAPLSYLAVGLGGATPYPTTSTLGYAAAYIFTVYGPTHGLPQAFLWGSDGGPGGLYIANNMGIYATSGSGGIGGACATVDLSMYRSAANTWSFGVNNTPTGAAANLLAGNILVSSGSASTTSTAGFAGTQGGAGVPTGTPASTLTGSVPLYVNTTTAATYGYYGAAWHAIGSGAGGTLGQAVNNGNVVNSVAASGQITWTTGGTYTTTAAEITGPSDQAMILLGGNGVTGTPVLGSLGSGATGLALATTATASGSMIFSYPNASWTGGVLIQTGALAGAHTVTNSTIVMANVSATTGGGGGIVLTAGGLSDVGSLGAVATLANGSTTTGGALTLAAGQGATTSTGGLTTINDGPGGSTSGAGGGITIQCSTPISGNAGALQILGGNGVASNNVGTTITLTPGNSVGSGAAGSLTSTAGQSATGTAGGVTFTAGLGGTTSGSGGIVALNGGGVTTTSSAGNGGACNIKGGSCNAGTTTTGTGGAVVITGGIGGSSSGSGGACSMTGGTVATGTPTSSNGGQVSVTGGICTSGNGTGGACVLAGGAATTAGNQAGGLASLTGGASFGSATGGVASCTGGAGGATGAGGSASLVGGAGGGTSGTGGGVFVTGGAATAGASGGAGGLVTIAGGKGNSTNQNAGGVLITTGLSQGTGTANIEFQTGFTLGSGTTNQTLGDRFYIAGHNVTLSTAGTGTASAVAVINIPTSNSGGGCMVFYQIVASDGTSWDTATGSFTVSCMNKAGTVTAGTAVITDESSAVTATHTLSAGAVTTSIASQAVTIKIAPTYTTIVPTSLIATVSFMVFGNAVTITPQ